MSDFLIAAAACIDLDEIWDHYGVELQNPDAADRIRDEIFDAFHKLAQTPGLVG
jgi:plasmid stabilization system protein ParE